MLPSRQVVVLAPGAPYNLTGDNDWAFAFCPNARDSHQNFNNATFPIGQRGMYQRSLSDVFIRGYKEYVTLATNSGAPWLWRRLVVTMKSPLWQSFPAGTVQREVPLTDNRSSGQTRALYNFGSVGGVETDLAKEVYAVSSLRELLMLIGITSSTRSPTSVSCVLLVILRRISRTRMTTAC